MIQADFSSPSLLIFITSTTGDGDPPENSTKFIRYIRRSKPAEFEKFKGRPYAVLGLGDTNYSNFNATAKRIDKWLVEVGGIPIVPKGLADDATGLEAVVDPWIESIWEKLPQYVKVDQTKADNYEKQGSAKFSLNKLLTKSESNGETTAAKVEIVAEKLVETTLIVTEPVPASLSINESDDFAPITLPLPTPDPNSTPSRLPAGSLTVTSTTIRRPLSSSLSRIELSNLFKSESTEDIATINHPKKIKVTSGKYLTTTKVEKQVLELELDLSDLFNVKSEDAITYIPGDAIGIFAPNPDALVLPILKRLSLDPEEVMMITPKKAGGSEWPAECSYYELFKHFVDLRGMVKKSLLRVLMEYADGSEREVLGFLCSTQGSLAYRELLTYSPTLLDLLSAFPSSTPPFSAILSQLSHTQPRYYSLTTSPLQDTFKSAVAFNVVDFVHSKTKRKIRGVCSGYLDDLVKTGFSGKNVEVDGFLKVRGGKFEYPAGENGIIMIAAGTGVSPFAGFVRHRELLKSDEQRDICMITGRRFISGDALYRDVFQSESVKNLYEAVSRETESSELKKKYVQDVILDEEIGKKLWKMVNDGSYLFVCGGLEMSADVQKTLYQLSILYGDAKDENDAKSYWMGLTKNGKYVREIW
ncbi:hypothetical protein HK098_003835 [Nowakowskiella sp. JEL0407]|nr:hypothetical protein HK098_003835 [Nowakowskiella sp. JEL0407]